MSKDKLSVLSDMIDQLQNELEGLRLERAQEAAKRRRSHRRWTDDEKRMILAKIERARMDGTPIIDVLSQYKITSTHALNWTNQLAEKMDE